MNGRRCRTCGKTAREGVTMIPGANLCFVCCLMTAGETTSFLSQTYRVPTVDLDGYEVDAKVIAMVPRELCEAYVVLPVCTAGSSLIVATTDPENGSALAALKEATSLGVEPVIASESAIRAAIQRYYVRRI